MKQKLIHRVEFSVVILTFNSEKTIRELIKNLLLSLHAISVEFIIIDSGSSDSTLIQVRSVLNRYSRWKLIQVNKNVFRYDNTRNIAINKAKGDYILFISSDCYLKPQKKLFSRLRSMFEKDIKIVAVYGKQVPFNKHNLVFKNEISTIFSDLNRFRPKQIQYTIQTFKDLNVYKLVNKERLLYFLSNVFCSYRRSFLMNNKFIIPNGLQVGEDLIMGKRIIDLKLKKVFDSAISVLHSHDFSFQEYFSRIENELLIYKLLHIKHKPNYQNVRKQLKDASFIKRMELIYMYTVVFCIKFIALISAEIRFKKMVIKKIYG